MRAAGRAASALSFALSFVLLDGCAGPDTGSAPRPPTAHTPSYTSAAPRPDITSSVPAPPAARHSSSEACGAGCVNGCAPPAVKEGKEDRSMFRRSIVALSIVGLLAGTGVALPGEVDDGMG